MLQISRGDRTALQPHVPVDATDARNAPLAFFWGGGIERHAEPARPSAPHLLSLAVPGALERYDLPDLAALLGKRLSVGSSGGVPAASNK